MAGIPKRKSFVALFDILGFRNIVKINDLSEVFKTYRDIKIIYRNYQGHLRALQRKEPPKIHNFSDTFLIYTADITNLPQKEIDTTFQELLVICDSLFIAANKKKLPIRGAITAGELIVSNGIEIGKSIVEAYEKEQKQDWIGCWITQKSINLISRKALEEHIKDNAVVKYEIPLKDGKVKKLYAFNWLKSRPFQLGDFGILEKKKRHDWSAERKHINTWKFVEFIRNKMNANEL